MLSKRSSMTVLSTIVVMSALVAGCSAKEDSDGGNTGGTSGAGGAGTGGDSGTGGGAGGTSGAGASGGTGGAGGAGTGGGGSGTGGASGMNGGEGGTGGAAEMTKEELFPEVQDWAALDVIYDNAYSAYDGGEHTFQVPFHVQDSEVALADWFAIPASAVTIDEDPELADEGGGIIVTIMADVPEITIGVHSGMLGGTAVLKVTSATPELWEMGRARYDNGVLFDFPELTPEEFAQLLLNPDYMLPAPEPNTACNSCHSTGAKYFEIQHTPTQAARFSDEDLTTILTMGMKPEGVGFRVLPDMLGDQTNVEIYAEYHRWDASADEIKGLIVYLRSLTPTGQGDIKLPDGTYVAPGTMPPMP